MLFLVALHNEFHIARPSILKEDIDPLAILERNEVLAPCGSPVFGPEYRLPLNRLYVALHACRTCMYTEYGHGM